MRELSAVAVIGGVTLPVETHTGEHPDGYAIVNFKVLVVVQRTNRFNCPSACTMSYSIRSRGLWCWTEPYTKRIQ